MVSDHNDRGETDHAANQAPDPAALAAERTPDWLPEWNESEAAVDDAAWVAALEASRRRQFAELADL